MTKPFVFAGIGARKIELPIFKEVIPEVGKLLSLRGWMLRSGAANGSDTMFENGVDLARGTKEIFAPWDGFNGRHSPNVIVPRFNKRTEEIAIAHMGPKQVYTKNNSKLFCRNVNIILGEMLNSPVDMVVSYTNSGTDEGGTGHAMRVANSHGIPMLNLNDPFLRSPDRLREELMRLILKVEKGSVRKQ